MASFWQMTTFSLALFQFPHFCAQNGFCWHCFYIKYGCVVDAKANTCIVLIMFHFWAHNLYFRFAEKRRDRKKWMFEALTICTHSGVIDVIVGIRTIMMMVWFFSLRAAEKNVYPRKIGWQMNRGQAQRNKRTTHVCASLSCSMSTKHLYCYVSNCWFTYAFGSERHRQRWKKGARESRKHKHNIFGENPFFCCRITIDENIRSFFTFCIWNKQLNTGSG